MDVAKPSLFVYSKGGEVCSIMARDRVIFLSRRCQAKPVGAKDGEPVRTLPSPQRCSQGARSFESPPFHKINFLHMVDTVPKVGHLFGFLKFDFRRRVRDQAVA